MAGEQEALGAEIAAARSARGLSVEDVARATRVRPATLRALEAGDLAALGAPVYARGHLRSVASAVGADPAPWLHVYEEQVGTPAPATSVLPAGADPATRRANSAGVPVWLQVAAGAVLFMVVLGVVGLVSGGDEDAPDDVAVQATVAPSAAAPAAAEDEPPADPAAPGPDAVAQAPQEVVLQVRVTGQRSWLRISKPDNTVLFEGTLDNGAVREFRDDERLRVLVGDAGAVALSVNGQDLGVAGAQGEVARLEYTPQDPAGV